MLTSITRYAPRFSALVVAVALTVAAPNTSAQCFGPDHLDAGLCCQPIVPNLPSFPAATPPGSGICWSGCTVAGTLDLRVQWTPPSQIVCGEYISQLTVSDAGSGVTLLTGTLILDYTRTWEEVDTTGVLTQVWRFAAKADLSAVSGVPPSPCITPSCIAPIGPYGTAFYYGYVDYANCDLTLPWDNVLVLFHNCDRFIHSPGLSDKPGVFHADRSYAIVAPHSAVQPFVPMNAVASGGPLIGEATRNVNSSSPPLGVCTVEDEVIIGDMTVFGAGCICSFSTTPNQQTLRKLEGQNACLNAAGIQGAFTSVDLGFPTFPWLHLVSTSLGSWTTPTVYPGKEFCWVDEGVFAIQDACTGDFAEIKYGGSTRDGWMPLLPVGVVLDDFTDLADNYSAPLFGPYPGPFVGSVRPSNHLLYVNVP